jgi:hypothetical protein
MDSKVIINNNNNNNNKTTGLVAFGVSGRLRLQNL